LGECNQGRCQALRVLWAPLGAGYGGQGRGIEVATNTAGQERDMCLANTGAIQPQGWKIRYSGRVQTISGYFGQTGSAGQGDSRIKCELYG